MQVVVDFHDAHGCLLELENIRTIYDLHIAQSIGCRELKDHARGWDRRNLQTINVRPAAISRSSNAPFI